MNSDSLSVRVAAGAVGTGLALAALAPLAGAEGAWASSFSGWLPGVSSRTWTDNDRDAASTTIGLSGCSAEVGNPWQKGGRNFLVLRLQLTRETPWWQPDQDMGKKDFACEQGPVSQSWGRMPSSGYHFTLTHVNGSEQSPYGKVSANSVSVSY